MLEVLALIKDWEETAEHRLFLDADRVVRDPRLAVAGVTSGKGARRFLSRGGAASTPEARYVELYRREVGPVGVTPSMLEEAAYARLHLADVLTVGRALDHACSQHRRIRDIPTRTRVQLLRLFLEVLRERGEELVAAGLAEGRTRKGMDLEIERISAFLSTEVLEGIASNLLKRKWDDGTRMFTEGLGTVGVMVPPLGGPSRTAISLAASLMTGNYTLMAAPCDAPVSTAVVAKAADDVLRERGVHAVSAMVPDAAHPMLGVLSESPRVDALVLFQGGERELEACAQAHALGKAVVGAWETTDVAIVWDGVDVASAAEHIVASRFTDSGRTPSAIGRVLVHPDAHDELVSALEGELHGLRVGLPSDPSTDVGPVASLGDLERLEEVVAEACELGAQVLHGGTRINWKSEAEPVGLYFQPTLITGCDAGMRIMNERLVGPVLPICRVPDEATARKLACMPRRPGRAWIWATSRADRDRLVEGLRAPGIVFFGRQPEGPVRAMDLADAWGALELAERLSYKSWRGPVGQ